MSTSVMSITILLTLGFLLPMARNSNPIWQRAWLKMVGTPEKPPSGLELSVTSVPVALVCWVQSLARLAYIRSTLVPATMV